VLQKSHIPVDMLNANGKTTLNEIQAYKYLVYPHPTILSEQLRNFLNPMYSLEALSFSAAEEDIRMKQDNAA
jgi:hypothetical protein